MHRICAVVLLFLSPLAAQSRRILYQDAARAADFTVDSSAWGAYVLEAEIQFTQALDPFRVTAGGELEAVPDESGGEIRLRVLQGGRTLAEEIERLKPQPSPRWGAGAEDELKALARTLPGWQERWFPLRLEVTGEEVWFAFDGRSLAPAPLAGQPPRAIGFHLRGARLRNLVVREGAWTRGGYLPVPLAGYTHGEAPRAQSPARDGLALVGGIPFRWSDGAAIDLGKAGLRLRKKPTGPGSLYQNPFNAISAMDGDPLTILLRVPKRFYRRMHVLAAVHDPQRSPKFTVRLTRYRGDAGSLFADMEVTVPARHQGPTLDVKFAGGPGRLQYLEIPLDTGALQGVLKADLLQKTGNRSAVLQHDAGVPWLDIELTRELQPDLQAMLPLGPPSGVHVYAVTLEESPLELLVTPEAAGGVYVSPETPRYRVWLRNVSPRPVAAQLHVTVRDPYGVETRRAAPVTVRPGEELTREIALPQKVSGHFDAMFALEETPSRPLVTRRTTFAVLPPDTRRAERDSPFGMWAWGGAHLSPPNEVEAALMRKAGVRHTLGVGYPSKQEFGIGRATDIVTGIFYASTPVPGDPAGSASAMIGQMKTRGSNPRFWQMYWEDMISERHHRRFPPALIGRPPLVLNDAEQARFQAYWDRAEAYARAVRKELPQEKLALGAYLNFTEEFLRRGFAKSLLDALSLEVGGYRAQPERPPDTDTVHGLYLLQELKKKYGYADLETIMVESLYHGTAPGYLSEREQASYYVRDHLLAMAYGVRLFGMSAMIADVAGDYYRSSWGNVGLCHRAPEANPKPSYVAYATMTQVLDRARFVGDLDTGSTSAYALRFQAPDGANLYALWTVRGQREARLRVTGQATVIDAMQNARPLAEGRVRIGESPVYVRTAGEIAAITLGPPEHAERPPAHAVLVDPLSDTGAWTRLDERSELLETVNPRYPRRPGSFELTAGRDAAKGAVTVITAKPVPGPPLVPRYGVLAHRTGLRLPGQPKRLGLWVRGNSSWSRIGFELTDAQGERWTLAGGGEDIYGRSFVNFDGWRWMEIDLCGHFRPDYPRPPHGNWTSQGGDGLVDYPLKLTRLVVELRDQVVQVNRLAPVKDASFALAGLHALE